MKIEYVNAYYFHFLFGLWIFIGRIQIGAIITTQLSFSFIYIQLFTCRWYLPQIDTCVLFSFLTEKYNAKESWSALVRPVLMVYLYCLVIFFYISKCASQKFLQRNNTSDFIIILFQKFNICNDNENCIVWPRKINSVIQFMFMDFLFRKYIHFSSSIGKFNLWKIFTDFSHTYIFFAYDKNPWLIS